MKKEPKPVYIRPAFKSPRELLAATVLLAVALLSPWLFSFSSGPLFFAPYSNNFNYKYFYDEIYVQKDPIDLLFVGPCTVWWHIDSSIIGDELERRLGRPVHIVSLAHNHYSPEVDLMNIREISKHREVRNILTATPRYTDLNRNSPIEEIIHWRWSPYHALTDTSDLAFASRAYSASTFSAITAIRYLLWPAEYRELETTSAKNHFRKDNQKRSQFVPGARRVRGIFSQWDDRKIQLLSPKVEKKELELYQKMYRVAKQNNSNFFFLSAPLVRDLQTNHLRERLNWWNHFADAKLVGLTPRQILDYAKLESFDTISKGENLNQEGAQIYSSALVETMLEIVKNGDRREIQ